MIVFEGRDAAGKGGTINAFRAYLNHRHARTVALSKPSETERGQWYYQRYIQHFPTDGDLVMFDRSWYNRAGVEPVMGFCTKEEYEAFMQEVGSFEQMLVHSGMIFIKYYLDISKEEQKRRLEARKKDPLKQWKLSPIDMQAQKLWKKYSKYRDRMFERTSFVFAPWHVVHSDDKKTARINVMKHFLSHVDYPEKDEKLLIYDNDVVCEFDPVCYERGLIAP
jgi:polyphosphate kinase 2